MIRRLTVLLLALVTEPGCTQPAASEGAAARPSTPTSVTGAEARSLVAAGAQLVDVRTPEEFSEGHLDGARNVPVDDLASHLTELPRDRTLVVYCRSGHRSARAAATLRSAGFTVRDLGPMGAW